MSRPTTPKPEPVMAALALCTLPLLGCSEYELHATLNSLNASLNSTGSAQASSDLQPYNQGSSVSEAQVHHLFHYVARGQSLGAMRSLLGTPAQISEWKEVYPIAHSSDGVDAGRRLVVLYRADRRTNYQTSEAYDWYLQ